MPTKEHWNWVEITLFALLFICFLSLRLFNIFNGAFPNVDEVSALNQLNLNLATEGSASTTFVSSTILLKIFYPVLGFPGLRLLSVLFASCALLVFYTELRRNVGLFYRLLAMAMLTFSWYYVYITRLFEVGSFVAPMALLTLAFIMRYLRTKSMPSIYLAAIAFAVGLEFNATPFIYGGVLFGMFLVSETIKGWISWKHLIGIGLIIAIIISPFLWTIQHKDPITKAPLWTYGYFGEPNEKPILAINARHPVMAAKSMGYFFFFQLTEKNVMLFSMLGLLLVLIPLLLWLKPLPNFYPFLAGYTLLLILLAVSTAPIYHQGQMHILWLLWILLVPAFFQILPKPVRVLAILVLCGLFAFQVLWCASLAANQVSEATAVFAKYNIPQSRVFISDGAMLKVKYYPGLYDSTWPIFYCDKDGVREFFSSQKPPFIVILTNECPQDQICNHCRIERVAEFNQIQEPYLQHGMQILLVQGMTQ